MRTQTTIECSPAVGSVQPSPVGAFSYPLLNRRTRSSKFHFYVKVDAADILPDNLKRWSDYANYIQHRIIVGRMYWQAKKTGYVSLHRRTLERAIHHSILRPVLDWLLENEVIDRDGDRLHWTGFKPARRRDGSDGISIGYGFGEAYEHRPIQRVACRSVKANNKFRKFQNSQERMEKYTKVHRHLRSWLRRVTIDLPAALKLVEAAKLDPAIAEQVIILATYIANGDATDLTVCNYGRVHTAITRLLALIRSCLSIGGQRLIELDLACSQPLFLVIYILKTIGNPRIRTLPDILSLRFAGFPNHDEFVNSYSSLSTSSSDPFWIHPYLPTLPTYLLYDPRKCGDFDVTDCSSSRLQKKKSRNVFLPPDLLFFAEICMAGALYDYLMRRCGWTDDRGSFKKAFFEMIYGPMKETPMTQIMRQEFPSVMAFISWHKGRHGYKELSREMQRSESKLMIEGVCGSLREQNRKIPLVTIHDSISTTSSFIPVVRETIVREFGKLGIQPTVKTKGTAFETATLPSLEDFGSFNPWDAT